LKQVYKLLSLQRLIHNCSSYWGL